jgi:hypothetical protein
MFNEVCEKVKLAEWSVMQFVMYNSWGTSDSVSLLYMNCIIVYELLLQNSYNCLHGLPITELKF